MSKTPATNTPDYFALAKKHLIELHDHPTRPPNRAGVINNNGVFVDRSGGCLAQLSTALYELKTFPFAFSVCHGDGAPLSFEALYDSAQFNKELAAFTQPFNKLVPTERSREWVAFLLSPESPWRDMHPFIAEKDVDFCNNYGFIYSPGTPVKLAYNFGMAVRFAWELPRQFALWLELRKDMYAPKALYIATNFELAKEARTLEGPYDIMYPWSFLESSEAPAAGRFILGMPANIDKETSPNVLPLWNVDGTAHAEASKIYQRWIEADKLILSDLSHDLDTIVGLVQKQLTPAAEATAA
jgi:hypothetical protein